MKRFNPIVDALRGTFKSLAAGWEGAPRGACPGIGNRPALALIACLSLWGSACDPSYVVHMQVSVRLVDGPMGRSLSPVEGAWVFPVEAQALADRQYVKTDPRGLARLDAGGFLSDPGRLLAVYKPGYRTFVGIAEQDYHRSGRGWIFVTEWDAQIVANLAPLGTDTGVPLNCGPDRRCTLVIPYALTNFCIPHYLAVDHNGVREVVQQPRGAAPGEVWAGCSLAGNGGLRCIGTYPKDLDPSADVFVVVQCSPHPDSVCGDCKDRSYSIHVVVSDVTHLPP